MEKAVKDAAALARSLAAGRERSTEAAERAVTESASFTAEEARSEGLIDVIARDRAHLLDQLDGRTITRFGGRTETLELSGAEVVTLERTFAERVLTVLASPQLAYLLLMLGAIGLLVEVTSPGLVVPGVAGGIALLLGLYGFSILPVNVVGALLIAAGLALLVAEVFVTSYGMLALGGIVAFVVGSLILVDTPVPRVSSLRTQARSSCTASTGRRRPSSRSRRVARSASTPSRASGCGCPPWSDCQPRRTS
jgi:membrane-bound serine protease (ClpP class)